MRHVGHVAREEEKTLDTRKVGHESTWTLGAREDVGNEAREACEARQHVEPVINEACKAREDVVM